MTQTIELRKEIEPSRALTPVSAGLPSREELEVAKTMAEAVAKTAFAAGWQQSPVAVLSAMLWGREMGLGPVNSVLNVNVIQGKPSPSAELTLALIRRGGHSVQVMERSDTKLVVRGKRKDTGDTDTVTWTWERATKIGLTGKENWRKYPQQMLFARAVSELATSLFSDVALGLMTPDELGLDGTIALGSSPTAGEPDEREVTTPVPVAYPSPEASATTPAPSATPEPRKAGGRPKGSKIINGKLVRAEDLPQAPDTGENDANDHGTPEGTALAAMAQPDLPSYMQGGGIGPGSEVLEAEPAQVRPEEAPPAQEPATPEAAQVAALGDAEKLQASVEASEVAEDSAAEQIWRYAKLIKQAQAAKLHIALDLDSIEIEAQANESLDKFSQDRWQVDYADTTKQQRLVILAALLALHRQVAG